MITIRYAAPQDRSFWLSLDRHLPAGQFEQKVRQRQAYLALADGEPAGLLRYNLFWDCIPFCTLLFVTESRRGQGMGTRLMAHWEQEMRSLGFGMALTSTRSDESAQHFYRRLGYRDCGGLVLTLPEYAQPLEIFLYKQLREKAADGQNEN